MKQKNFRKKWMAGLAALVLTLSTAAGSLAAVRSTDEAARQAEKTFRFRIRTEAELAAEAGLDAEQWAADMQARTKAGRQDPLTETMLRSENPEAEILRENEGVYMIRGVKGLGNIRGPEDACKAAGRIDALAGGTDEAALVLTNVLEAGENATVYLFRQQFEGADGLTEDRVLKIAVDALGQPTAVFSSLSPERPEFPDEDLPEETEADQDPAGPEEYGPEEDAQRIVYPPEQTFEYMERLEWSGTVTGADGTEQALTVPVMRDGRTGVWYLGDPERRIAVGDFASMAYEEERVLLTHRDQNGDWNDEDLITYANAIRAWDFFASMGWIGPDGHGTPMLLLRNMCDEYGTPIFNAAYLGEGDGWQCFAWGEDSYLGQGLDVIAHEFTHCVTETAMGANLYQDDYGAINEAMSDILGNLCEAICAKEGTPDWLVGEDTGFAMRNMLDPHAFGQPEYVWDLYYAPNAFMPEELNDMGGVHSNSSILNRVAARLCVEYGMSLTEAANFWITAACGMTPRTNYFRMPALLEWALNASGGERFTQALRSCVADARMTASTQEPETLPEGTRLVRLTLPETDGSDSLMLIALQLDSEEIIARLKAVGGFLQTAWNTIRSGSWSGLFEAWKDFLSRMDMEALTDALLSGDPDQVMDVALGSLQGLLTESSTWRQTDGRTASMVLRNRPTVYLLLAANDMMEEDPDMDPEADTDMDPDEDPETAAEAFGGMAVLVGDKWIDLISLISALPAADEETQDLSDEQAAQIEALLEPLGTLALDLAADLLTGGTQAEDMQVIELPTAGLEAIWNAPKDPAA
ncbi:MAG: M4 family metallopeptidase [Clostridia bacterium]|nr:M4 family metallopeptidase [Clostridia bacterium]